MTGDQEQWQLDQSAAELYQRHFVRAVTDLWAADLVERADVAEASGFSTSPAEPASSRGMLQPEPACGDG